MLRNAAALANVTKQALKVHYARIFPAPYDGIGSKALRGQILKSLTIQLQLRNKNINGPQQGTAMQGRHIP